MANFPNGTYSINLPFGGGSITDAGEGRFLNLLPEGALGPDANKIKFEYDSSKKGYSFQFAKSRKYITFMEEPRTNNKLVTGDKPRYFVIKQHEYEEDKYQILVAESQEYSLGPALERIYPPWVAMVAFPDKQAWTFNKIEKAML